MPRGTGSREEGNINLTLRWSSEIARAVYLYLYPPGRLDATLGGCFTDTGLKPNSLAFELGHPWLSLGHGGMCDHRRCPSVRPVMARVLMGRGRQRTSCLPSLPDHLADVRVALAAALRRTFLRRRRWRDGVARYIKKDGEAKRPVAAIAASSRAGVRQTEGATGAREGGGSGATRAPSPTPS